MVILPPLFIWFQIVGDAAVVRSLTSCVKYAVYSHSSSPVGECNLYHRQYVHFIIILAYSQTSMK